MGKCFVCCEHTTFMCGKCESLFCEDHGDLEMMMCEDCLEFEHLTKEESNKALEKEFSLD